MDRTMNISNMSLTDTTSSPYISIHTTRDYETVYNNISTKTSNYVNNHHANTTMTPSEKEGLMSDDLRYFFETMNFVILSGIISFAGLIANTINIIVFIKQGFKESISRSLLGLAISDFGALLTLVWMSICFNPYFAESDIPFNSPKVQYLTAGWPHVCFARITSIITAYITIERCLCVVLPLRVKTIFTPKRTAVAIITIFLTIIASVLPVYYAIRLDWVYNEDKNMTLIDLVYVDDGEFIENISFSINVVTQISSFVMVIICTSILVHCIRINSKWRQKATVFTENTTVRDRKVVKMVMLLATIFIVCFLPSAVNLLIMISISEYSIVGRYENIFQTSWSFLNTLEATNSSINIFIYYKMSSNYRKTFKRLFHEQNEGNDYESTQ